MFLIGNNAVLKISFFCLSLHTKESTSQGQNKKIVVVLEEMKQLNVGDNGGGSRKNL